MAGLPVSQPHCSLPHCPRPTRPPPPPPACGVLRDKQTSQNSSADREGLRARQSGRSTPVLLTPEGARKRDKEEQLAGERERTSGLACRHVELSRGDAQAPAAAWGVGGLCFLCPTQQPALPVTAGMSWSITPCKISRHCWLYWHMATCPHCQGKGDGPKMQVHEAWGGLADPSIAPSLLSPPLPLSWDLLQSSSSWDVDPCPGAAPSCRTPQTPCQCLSLLRVLSVLSPVWLSSPSPRPLPADHSPLSCSSRCPHPRPHAGSVTPPAPSASGQGGQAPMALVGGHTSPVGYQSIFAGHRPFLRKSSRTALQPTSATRAPRLSWWWAQGLLVLQRLWAEGGRAQPQPPSRCPYVGDSKRAPEPAMARDLGWGWRD